MQRARNNKDGIATVPPLRPGHYFIEFTEEFWDMKPPSLWRTGRIEIYRPGDMYDWLELRWYYPDNEYMATMFNIFRDYWDFTNITEREFDRLKRDLAFFQTKESDPVGPEGKEGPKTCSMQQV